MPVNSILLTRMHVKVSTHFNSMGVGYEVTLNHRACRMKINYERLATEGEARFAAHRLKATASPLETFRIRKVEL